jgi:hypothetical protein
LRLYSAVQSMCQHPNPFFPASLAFTTSHFLIAFYFVNIPFQLHILQSSIFICLTSVRCFSAEVVVALMGFKVLLSCMCLHRDFVALS